MSEHDRLPTSLWVDAHLRQCSASGIPAYVVRRGSHAGGCVALKLYMPGVGAKVLIQARDIDGNAGWLDVFNGKAVEESAADDYIQREIAVDPDLWVIEIEDRDGTNPFDGPLIE